MSFLTLDQPDWTNAPRGFRGATVQPQTSGSLAAGASTTWSFQSNQLDEVGLLIISADAEIYVVVKTFDPSGLYSSSYQRFLEASYITFIPFHVLGGRVDVVIQNLSAATARGYNWVLNSYVGGALADLRGESFMNTAALNVPAASFSPGQPASPGGWDRIGWVAGFSQAFDVWANFDVVTPPTYSIQSTKLVAGAAAGAAVEGEIIVPSAGVVVYLHNNAGVAGTGYISTRTYRAA